MSNNNQHHWPNSSMHGSTGVAPGTTIGGISGGGGTSITINPYSNPTYQISPYTSAEIIIDMDHTVFNVEGKKIKASEIIERLQKLEEIVGVLAENPSAHPALKAAYDKYKTLETLLGEKKDD